MNPFDSNKFIGYLCEITPQYVRMQFPSTKLLHSFYYEGQIYLGGNVGSFLVIEGKDYGFLGRLIEMNLPQGEKIEITEKRIVEENSDFHPIGKVELLALFDVYNPQKIEKTVSRYPNIGAKVYACSDEQIGYYIKRFGEKEVKADTPYAELGKLTANEAKCNVSLNSIFGRHCAVLGTTGGGKSWTVASLVEMISGATNNKCILIDATGEYDEIATADNMESIVMGTGEYIFNYRRLTIDEMYFLLKPSAKVQVPKLMDAIRSLKMYRIAGANDLNDYKDAQHPGTLMKSGKQKRPFNAFYYNHISEIEDKWCDFDFTKLSFQIRNECIWDTAGPNNTISWGGEVQNDISNCVSLMSRINNVINTGEYNKIFGFKPDSANQPKDMISEIDDFLAGDKSILRLDFSNVSFDYQVREILVNSIGRNLLERARDGKFKTNPLIVFVDEAHQFLNKSIKDDYFNAKPLDAFEQISKEARKYGLFVCIATQMPRDIPLATLSQMGTFIVHRLINDYDKKAVEDAASTANRNILSFLPILGEGEAVLVGVDFPMPLTVKIKEPEHKPNSKTPRLEKRL